MSGPSSRSFSSDEASAIVKNVRGLSGIAVGTGPDDKHIVTAVGNFVHAFEFWYVKVMREAVPKYRDLIIKRINPFVRRIECDGLSPEATAARLVDDYNARNFVTAGGWALEGLAIGISPTGQKSSAEGIDIQRIDPTTGAHHLYVLKSGLVTRNSDILNALKKNAKMAEKLLRQGGSLVSVIANYAILAGKTSSNFEDGVRRPSSAEFWSEMTGLPSPLCIELVLAVAAEGGRLVKRDASDHLSALKQLCAEYIAMPDRRDVVDWEFIAIRNMQSDEVWKADDRTRHKRALAQLETTGYVLQARERRTPGVLPRRR